MNSDAQSGKEPFFVCMAAKVQSLSVAVVLTLQSLKNSAGKASSMGRSPRHFFNMPDVARNRTS